MEMLILKRLILHLMLFSALVAIPSNSFATNTYSEESNRKIISIKRGSEFRLTLHSTYWSKPHLSGRSLEQVGNVISNSIDPGPSAPPGCTKPGIGCGDLTWNFKAKRVGMTVITIKRNICGEALRCVGKEGLFRLTVRVSR